MRKYILIVLIIAMSSPIVFGQEKKFDLIKALSGIKEGTRQGTLLNNKLVEKFIVEYIQIGEEYGMSLLPEIKKINFIFVEPSEVVPAQLSGENLGKVDFNEKLILLSNYCLLDSNMLKATLFREISHYLGVPYINEGHGIEIMSINKPEGYSYGWLTDYCYDDIQQIEYNRLFTALKKHLN